ncbi:MAG TPA: Gfo/Idh/MocA family oxidoreductase [Leptolinea sp.]
MKKIRAGVIGVGFIGVAHIEALRRLGNIDVVAIADPVDGAAKADRLGIPKGYADYKEMLEKESLDFVHICTPNYTHCEIALYAMDRNVNVVCEKPMCVSVHEADLMIAKAKEKGLVNGVNYHNRWYPMTAQLKEMVKAGDLGTIHAIYGEFSQDWLLYDTDYNWRIESAESGRTRAVSDIGTHWMDLVENVTGLAITEVFADFKILHKTRKKPVSKVETFVTSNSKVEYKEVPVDTEDHANVLMHFSNGAIGSAVFSQIIPGRKAKLAINIAGIKESVSWCCDTCNELWLGRRGENSQIFEKDPSLLSENVRVNSGYPGGHGEGFPDAIKNNFRAMYADMGKPGKKPDYATFETGRHELVLCDKILESAKKGIWVPVA